MTDEEREASRTFVYHYLPSCYGMKPDQLHRADAIEVVGQEAKPGGGGMLLGQKITDRDKPLKAMLGDSFSASCVKLKMQEWDEYSKHLTEWERETTLDC